MWRAVLSHLPPDEVMRVRRVNHLFYAVALDHRFRTLSILDETFDDDEVSKVENNVKTFMRKLGDAA